MEPTFSEFSYGFAVTNEFAGLMNLSVAPIFPSLLEEGKAGGGYDVKFDKPGVPLFLQFKRSEHMVHPSAREYGMPGATISLPYDRFWITPSTKSRQHEMLLNIDTPQNQVYYVAPKFHRVEDLNDAWQAQSVIARSIFLRPRAIGLMPDSGKHSIAFDHRAVWRCSEPKEVEASDIDDVLRDLQAEISDRKRSLREELAEWDSSLKVAREVEEEDRSFGEVAAVSAQRQDRLPSPPDLPAMKKPSESDPDRLALQRIADRAKIEFDAQLFVVQESE